jgi:ankyrin repeat protein
MTIATAAHKFFSLYCGIMSALSFDERRRNMFLAAANNDENTVRRLIEVEGLSVKTTNQEDATVAHIAVRYGHLNIVKYLIQKDESLLTDVDYSGNTILYLAVEKGYLDIVEYLVEIHGQDVAQRNDFLYRCTPVHIAARYGHLSVLRYLVEKKNGDVDATNELKQTPVFLAAINKHLDVVKYLIESRKANATVVDHRNHNLLFVAVDENNMMLMKYLLDERKTQFDVNWRDIHGTTLVHRAALLNHLDCLAYLVETKHADVNAPDDANRTPLHSAARNNNYQICKYLVEHGANVNTENDEGHLPIQETTSDSVVTLLENVASTRNRRYRRNANATSFSISTFLSSKTTDDSLFSSSSSSSSSSYSDLRTLRRVGSLNTLWPSAARDAKSTKKRQIPSNLTDPKIDFSQLQNILLIAISAFVVDAKSLSFEPSSSRQFSSSPSDVTLTKIIPLAVESINASLFAQR